MSGSSIYIFPLQIMRCDLYNTVVHMGWSSPAVARDPQTCGVIPEVVCFHGYNQQEMHYLRHQLKLLF